MLMICSTFPLRAQCPIFFLFLFFLRMSRGLAALCVLTVAPGLVSEGEAAAAEEWLTGCNLPSPRSDQTAASPCPYLPMECNSCAGERRGGLAESPLTDPQRTAATPSAVPTSERRAGLLKSGSTKK